MNKEIAPVLDEIRAMLKKHDMVGLIVVGNATHVDFSMDLDASWNCMRIEREPEGCACVRIVSKRDQYPTKEAQHKTLQVTIGTVVTMHDIVRRMDKNLEQLLLTISKHCDFVGRSVMEE